MFFVFICQSVVIAADHNRAVESFCRVPGVPASFTSTLTGEVAFDFPHFAAKNDAWESLRIWSRKWSKETEKFLLLRAEKVKEKWERVRDAKEEEEEESEKCFT